MLPFFGRCLSPILESSSFLLRCRGRRSGSTPALHFRGDRDMDPDSQVESMALWGTVALPCGVWTPSVERPSDLQPVYERLGPEDPLRGPSTMT